MTKILLIQPNEEGRKLSDASMPLGLIYIGTYLKNRGNKIKILDRNFDYSDEYLKSVLKKEYDFVGIGTFTGRMLLDAIHVSKIVKSVAKSVVIWGGFHPTIDPENTLKNEFIDHIIRGEGEETFQEVIEHYEAGKDYSQIKGVDLNPPRMPPDIENLPLPDYDLIDIKKYPHFYVSTSRGCPFQCTFCYNSYGKESVKPYRNMSVDKSVELIRLVVEKYKKKTFTIVDDNFPSNKERLRMICEKIKGLKIRFDTFCRADYATDDEILKILKEAGCWQIQMGIETGSQEMLDFLDKRTTVKTNSEGIENCRKFGIMCHGSFMMGLPGENINQLEETIEFIKKNKPDLGGIGIFHPFPKTKLWDYCLERELLKKVPSTLEEWADAYPTSFIGTKMNVSSIPDEVLIKKQREINYLINKGRYSKKLIMYLKEGRLPTFKRVLSTLRGILINK